MCGDTDQFKNECPTATQRVQAARILTGEGNEQEDHYEDYEVNENDPTTVNDQGMDHHVSGDNEGIFRSSEELFTENEDETLFEESSSSVKHAQDTFYVC